MSAAFDRARFVFGCGNFGGLGSSPTLREKGDGQDRALSLLDEARDVGLTRFDTANTYGGGMSETLLGQWLARQGAAYRAEVEIATKVGNPNGCPPGERPLSAAQIAHHLDASLGRLGIERIDLYYIHEFDPASPLDETLAALELALSQGKIAEFGVSNATAMDLRKVLTMASGSLRAAFTTVQNGFNILETADTAEVIPLCLAEGLDYVAFSPLAGGLLTGKYRRGASPATGRMADAPGFFDKLVNEETFETIDRLMARAAVEGETVASVALKAALEIPGVSALIVAPRSHEQFADYGFRAA